MTQKETIIKSLKEFIKNNGKKIFYTIIFGGILLSIFDIVNPFFYKEIISIIEKYVKTDYFDNNLAIKVFTIWGIFIIFTTFFRAFIEYILVNSNLKNYKIRYKKYSNKIFYFDFKAYLDEKSGKLFKIYDRGHEDNYEFISIIFSEIIIAFFSILILSVVLFFINIKMAIATLFLVPIMIFIGIYFNAKTRKIQEEINNYRDESFGIIGDVLSNLLLVKTLVLEKVFRKKLEKKIEFADKKQKQVAYRWIIADIYVKFIFIFARFIVLGVGILEIKNNNLDIATLFLFFTFVGGIYFPLGFIFNRLKVLQRKLKGMQKFYEKFENLKIEKDNKFGEKLKNINGKIEYKNVDFSYNKSRKILNKVNFTINPGEKIALVGNTGAGKSTIINLLFKFYKIDSGEILLDGKNIEKIKTSFLRKNIGLVSQDNSLFNTTVKENLLFANPKATKKDLEYALRNAKCEFVFDLEDGINTIIGERGLKLSGGEKQRISIARLFLKNPKILILDEATSALDNKTENNIKQALDKLLVGRTAIIIAHRLSTIKNVDKIYMLENGKIIESGTYNELIEKKQKFYNLANF